ncbi:hypothetical protein HHK36_003435 [Tetracentron sinense]|uniref:Uncharacterized protein n=1 Tax=Tetracentron sinense TaxID=13715 RepID=A0A835DNY2_TETSI|nr:hypothetical protein HHK36_003435 [Tetracentron sinense]
MEGVSTLDFVVNKADSQNGSLAEYFASIGVAQSAIQYFENMRNFLMAVGDMKLLTFEASDLEKGGSSVKVVDCILCLKGFHEWKQAGGIGIWRYGGTVRITSLPKLSPSSLIGSESADESLTQNCHTIRRDPDFTHVNLTTIQVLVILERF